MLLSDPALRAYPASVPPPAVDTPPQHQVQLQEAPPIASTPVSTTSSQQQTPLGPEASNSAPAPAAVSALPASLPSDQQDSASDRSTPSQQEGPEGSALASPLDGLGDLSLADPAAAASKPERSVRYTYTQLSKMKIVVRTFDLTPFHRQCLWASVTGESLLITTRRSSRRSTLA